MRRIIFIIGFICSVFILQAQNTLKCVYQEKYIKDANRPEKFTYDEHVLAISGNRSAYYSRNARLRLEIQDSLLRQGINAFEVVSAVQTIPYGGELEG